jgi:hypothetical protein
MSDDFVPTNELEEALMQAAGDPAARPAFYRRLLEAKLFFVTPEAPASPGREVLPAGREVVVMSFTGPRGPFTPFFSSQERVAEVAPRMNRPLGFLALAGRDAFGLLAQRAQQAVLNPGFPFGKEFSPEEIRQLAAGSLDVGSTITVEEATEVLLGQPSQYPRALVDALIRLFAGKPSVAAAYLAQIHDPASGLPPHPIIGIVSDDYDQVVREAGMVANAFADGGPVDFMEADPARAEGVTEYLLQSTKPFYQRKADKPRWKFW